jgi:hypothetical protein
MPLPKFIFKYFCLAIAMFCIMIQASGQVPDFSRVQVLDDGDSLNITYLIHNGVKKSNGKVIAWFPKDSLSKSRMNEITGMINKGIGSAEKFMNAPLDWQVHDFNDPYTFYFRYDRFISHGSGAGFVSIPYWRIESGRAPWLHEAVHEMLNAKSGSWLSANNVSEKEWSENMPLWLYEGLADYISLKASLSENLQWFDVFSNDFQTDTDSLFVKDMKSDKASYILSFIGSKGVMAELFTEQRVNYAPAFYHGSCSFVKYLAEKYGLKTLLGGISFFGKEQETIEKSTGQSLEGIKQEWLNKLGMSQ